MKTNKQLIYTLNFAEVGLKDISRVGGKNASLGELFNALKSKGVGVIDGFRWSLLGTAPPSVGALLVSVGVVALLLASGASFFK